MAIQRHHSGPSSDELRLASKGTDTLFVMDEATGHQIWFTLVSKKRPNPNGNSWHLTVRIDDARYLIITDGTTGVGTRRPINH